MTDTGLREIRLAELRTASRLFPAGARVLEVGAGAGWQAREMAAQGFDVVGVDLAGSPHARTRVHPVIDYDGRELPFPDAEFDVVFSSNVLEHVPHVEAFQIELRRVLRPGGLAVHVLPTSTWRLWTTLAYPAQLVRLAARRLRGGTATKGGALLEPEDSGTRARGTRRLVELLLPARHGEHGNVFTETFLFCRRRWLALFRRAGWQPEVAASNGLFYTGYALLGPRLSLKSRRRLARVLGSTCLVYAMRRDAGG